MGETGEEKTKTAAKTEIFKKTKNKNVIGSCF